MSDTQKNLNLLGFGAVAYFDLQKYLIVIFSIMFILLFPSLLLFRYYPNGRKIGSSSLNKYTIGNLGFSSVLCKDVSLQVGNITMSCPTGEMREIISAGLIPRDGLINDACLPNSETALCEKSFDNDEFLEDFNAKCLNNSTCTIDADKYLRHQGNPDCTSPYAQFYIQAYCMHSPEEIEFRNLLNIGF
jgi:hypothetical protein